MSLSEKTKRERVAPWIKRREELKQEKRRLLQQVDGLNHKIRHLTEAIDRVYAPQNLKGGSQNEM